MCIRDSYGSADREWGLPQKSSLLEGFYFKTLRLILHFLRLTIVSRTLSEPLWSDSHIILFLSKYTFFICICRSQATIKTATERLYVLYLHTPISGAKPALLCTAPDLVRSIKTPLEDFTSHRVFMPNMATYVKQWKRKSRSFANSFYLSTVEPAKHTPQPDSHQKSWSFANSFSKGDRVILQPTPSHWK